MITLFLHEEGNPAGLSSCSGSLRPLVELCVDPAGFSTVKDGSTSQIKSNWVFPSYFVFISLLEKVIRAMRKKIKY